MLALIGAFERSFAMPKASLALGSLHADDDARRCGLAEPAADRRIKPCAFSRR
jgi:hypothetical protein